MVTGAASGIGAAIAGRLAGEGGRVVIIDLDFERSDITGRSLYATEGAELH
jgi:NAD(P)-dependent dehydrogenase (short-subunit alcohol dehydrogenase family)